MRDQLLSTDLCAESRQPEPSRVWLTVGVAGAATCIVGPTLVALAQGADYRVVVMLGALAAVGLALCARTRLPAHDVAGRFALAFTAAYAAMLLCVYAAEWLDWAPPGVDDAIVGLAAGLLLTAWLARRALEHPEDAPGAASEALGLIVVAPAAVALLARWYSPLGSEDAYELGVRIGLGASLALAWLGAAYAWRCAWGGWAGVLSMFSGVIVFMLASEFGLPAGTAAWAATIALAGSACLFLCRKDVPWDPRCGTPRVVLAGLAIAGGLALAFDAPLLAGCLGASAGIIWWGHFRRRGIPLFPARGRRRGGAGDWSLELVLAGALWILMLACGFLFSAAAKNATGPMLLSALRDLGVFTVSDLTFSKALLADQYLWRADRPSPRRVAAASPERLLHVARHERDRWSGAELLAVSQADEARRRKGMGLEFSPGDEDGWRIAYVFPGSPAHAAGLRRGDLVTAIDGIGIEAIVAGGGAGSKRATGTWRLEVASGGRAHREVVLAPAEYARPAAIEEKIVEVAGRRVGYLVLRDFLGTAAEEFLNAVDRLRERGMDELVLDLRMNSGGSLHLSREIASAIAGPRLDGRTFLRVEHNERYRNRDVDLPFQAPPRGVLSLPRLFVITGEATCSASEALINALAPYLTVVTVGGTTCGKPVGMAVVGYGARVYSVITFRVLNARGEGDYFGGLRPTCRAEDDFAHALGDPREASLAAALDYIRHGRCAS
jgi:carboxyl-terminal processing protease